MTVARRFTVRGAVQGVGFRWAARDEAVKLGLVGSVRNLRDGAVEVEAQGEPDAVDRFAAWLLALTGPRMAAAARAVRLREGVTDVEVARAGEVVADVVAPTGLRRPDLLSRLADAGFAVGGNRGYHLLVALAVAGLLVIGAR